MAQVDGLLAGDAEAGRHRAHSASLNDGRVVTDKEARKEGFENAQDEAAFEKPAYRAAMILPLGIFMGYASLNALQRKVKMRIGISDDDKDASYLFSFAVSFLYIGNLCFRLLHNVLFAALLPRQRVYLSYCCMTLAMSIIAFGIFALHIQSIALVFVAYALGGVAVGSFEANLLSCISPLGHNTKTWAVLGIPIGYNIINIGSFVMLAASPDDIFLQMDQYLFVIIGCIIGAVTFHDRIPDQKVAGNGDSFGAFVRDVKDFREWLPIIKWNSLALMCDMCGVALFSGVMMYIFDNDYVPLFGANTSASWIISHNAFLAVTNLCTSLGDITSRKIMYLMKPINPLWFLLLTAGGAMCCLSKIAILAWPGIFLVFFANGSIYANTTRHIDAWTRKDQTLISLSAWLFLGDIGSVTGSNLVAHVKVWTGPVGCTHCPTS